MKNFVKEQDYYGQKVIYVEKCDKFEYEQQSDMPYLNRKYQIYITTNHLPTKEQIDKIY